MNFELCKLMLEGIEVCKKNILGELKNIMELENNLINCNEKVLYEILNKKIDNHKLMIENYNNMINMSLNKIKEEIK